jgi:transporter family protein
MRGIELAARLLVPTWVWLGLASAASGALVAIFAKVGLSESSPVAVTMVRALIMTAVVSIAALATGQASAISTLTPRAWLFVSLSGLAGAASWLAYFAALQTGQASAVSALDRLSIVFVIALAALVLGEALTWEKALGGALIVGGAYLVSR